MSFQANIGSTSSILMIVYMFAGSEETARCLFAFDIGMRALFLVWAAIGYLIHTTIVWIECNLNADQYISDILRPVAVPYIRGLSNVIFEQDNARPHVACRVLKFLDTQFFLLP